MFKSRLLTKTVSVLLSMALLNLPMLSTDFSVYAEEEVTAAENETETEAATSGTLGNISWNYGYSDDGQMTLFISGEGDIPTLEELNIDYYPWQKFSVINIEIQEGITSIPANFCSSTDLSISIPVSMECIRTGAFNKELRLLMLSTYSMDCIFEEYAFIITENTSATIIAYNYSTALSFAQENNLSYFSLGDKIQSQYTEGNLVYNLYDEYAAVSDYTGEDTSLIIPSVIQNLPVKKIGIAAFEKCDTLASVTLPDTITTIGRNAFYECTSLTEIVLPDSITAIGSDAFRSCTSLTSIILPPSLMYIQNSLFYGCTYLTEVRIPDSVTQIGASAFNGCTSLTEINFPDSITFIGSYAFSETGLTSIELPDMLVTLYEYSFYNCPGLTYVKLPENLERMNYTTFDIALLETLNIPDGVDVSIDQKQFNAYTDDTTDAVVPDYVTTMYSNSYMYYETITIGKNLKQFQVANFEAASSYDHHLKDIIISKENPYYCSENGIVYNKDKTEIIYVAQRYEYQDGIMTIPATVEKISYPLYNYSVSKYEVEDGNAKFKAVDGVLYDSEMKTLVAYPALNSKLCYIIPTGIETIGKAAFYNAKFEYVKVPQSVRTIEKGAFWLTYYLELILFDHKEDDIINIDEEFCGYYTSYGNFYSGGTPYYAYDGSVIEHQFPKHFVSRNDQLEGSCGEELTWKWNDFDLTISGSGDMTEYAQGEFPWSNLPVVNVIFSGENIKIAENAFAEDQFLLNLDLSGVTEIENSAFFSCKKLDSITGHDSVTMVKDNAFLNTVWERTMNSDDGMNVLGSVLIKYNGKSETAEIPDNITYVAAEAFSYKLCNTLYVPESDIIYNVNAFINNTALEHVRFKGSDTDITIEDFKSAGEACKKVILTDADGKTENGLGYTSDNSLMYLADALNGTPFISKMCDEYCKNIIESSGCTSDMTDAELITVLRNYMKNNVSYGFTYVENPDGSYTDGKTMWKLSSNMTHRLVGMLFLDQGVCSAYAAIVNNYTKVVGEEGFSSTLKSISNLGLNHEWNAIGLDTGTENEKWYYLDLSNGTYLIGYENPILSSNPEMFSYNSELAKNSDGTYTVTLTDGTVIMLQGSDLEISAEKGDVTCDGQISIDDATAALTIYAKKGAGLADSGFLPEQEIAADIDEDGTVTITDATAILLYYAKQGAGITPDWNEILG